MDIITCLENYADIHVLLVLVGRMDLSLTNIHVVLKQLERRILGVRIALVDVACFIDFRLGSDTDITTH